jgi:hypothetical protein
VIAHIFRKDLRLLYPLALVIGASHFIRAVLSAMLGPYMEPADLRVVEALLPYVCMLGVIVLTAAVVHQDPLLDSSEDFLVRPIRRWDLLLAKLLFVGVIVLGPVLLADVLEGVMSGFDLWASFAAALPDALSQFLLLALPAMALASVSRTLTQLLAGFLFLFFIYVALMVVQALSGGGGTPALSGGGLEWIRAASIAVLFLLIGAVVLPMQYLRRATFASRGMIALSGVLTSLLLLLTPWSSGFALQEVVSTGGAPAAPLTLAYAPEISRVRQADGGPPMAAGSGNFVSLFVPLQFQGVATDDILVADRAVLRIRSAQGEALFESTGPAFGQKFTRLRAWKSAGATHSSGSFVTFQQVSVPARLFARLKDVDVAVAVDYSLTVLRAQSPQILPALGGDDTADGRRCFTRADNTGDGLEIGCLSLAKPPSCASIYLRHDASGAQNPPVESCQPDYAPFRLTLSVRVVNRFNLSIPFQDSHAAKDAHVVIVPYEPVLHATRQLSIPSVRIRDWLVER